MDKVKLGRALGYGTRHAAKTLVAVAEAAATPDPRLREDRAEGASEAGTGRVAAPPLFPVRSGANGHVRAAGRSIWAPLATFSSALWLRVTGVFFALMALTMVGGAWRLRGGIHSGAAPHSLWHLCVFAGVALLFGYFAVSSFVRASLRERTGTARR